jgi:hypothetical protein
VESGDKPTRKREYEMKRAQVSIIYFSFLVIFSVVFLFAIYTLSNSLIETSTNEFSDYQIDNIAAKIRSNLVEMKIIAEIYNTTTVNLSRTISIPDRIGASEYSIRGNDTFIIFQTYGSNSIFKKVPIYWWNIDLDGQVLSTSGKVELNYYASDSKVRIS